MAQHNPDSKNKPLARPRSERKRFLNVIYFIDSNRTRTLKFSIKTSYLTLGTLSLLVGWSFLASLLLLREHGLNQELRTRSRDLLSAIFSYQTRYDQVYEKAYPSKDAMTLAAKMLPLPTAANPEVEPISVHDDKSINNRVAPVAFLSKKTAPINSNPSVPLPATAPVSPSILASVTAPTSSDSSNDSSADTPKEKVIENAIAKPAATSELSIIIENFSSLYHDETLTARFALKNLSKGSKASGTVVAMAKFQGEGQEPIWLNTRIEANGEPSDTSGQDGQSDQHFNIRYYKNKVFHFSKPADKPGVFAAIRIVVKDERGRFKEFIYPLSKEPNIQQSRLENRVDQPEEDEVLTPQ